MVVHRKEALHCVEGMGGPQKPLVRGVARECDAKAPIEINEGMKW